MYVIEGQQSTQATFMVAEFGIEKAEEIRDMYEESFGLNGLDFLWSLEDSEEVYEALNDFI